MSPRIIYERGKPETAFLVDADNVIFTKRVDAKGVEWSVMYFRQGIQILDLCAGVVKVSTNSPHTFPRPAQLLGRAGQCVWEEFPPYHRKIHDAAAEAILSLPLGEATIKSAPQNRVKVGKPVLAKGYSDWKLLTAWCWSKWEEERMLDSKAWSLNARWMAMKEQLGYPHKVGTFRKMCASMNLFVTESRKKR